MVLEVPRRRLARAINSKYIYGTVPVVNTVIFLLEMAIISRLAVKFNSYYADRPILTMMITNAVLGGIADTVAQSITSIKLAAARKPGGIKDDDTMAIEIRELDRKNPLNQNELIPDSKYLPPPFEFERLTRFMAYGFMMAPVQFKWFQFLSKAFPITKSSGLGPAMKMVAFDQLIFAPANFMVWPLVQIINFRLMPIQFQLPFVSTIGIAWTAYLSLSNAAEEADAKSAPSSPNIRLL
ncbi:Protein sym1 [Lachnellula cervina]|uniref:Protein sym1 n=1 Tax=Lachnellula cervina TaxID=1316786 RepID=A0A7D8UUB5_9HELO|nr:Protein sym1 [Lachnellula cervina]